MSVAVKVALRVRPLSEKEGKENTIVNFVPELQQIVVDHKQYTFDHAFSPNTTQSFVYESSIQPLFDQFVKGFNATILAYGQTGSGKTYSMGTDYNYNKENDLGILPRFTNNLFDWIKNDQEYQVKVSFLELYNEDIIDLLKKSTNHITIREDTNGNITWLGVHEEVVKSSADLLNCLYQGSIARTTASTDMNSKSSRSHAIFTVTLVQNIQTQLDKDNLIKKKLESKFHFVDLAGSERLKKTNAVGERAKEGISINAGLLALGNVISALTTTTNDYVPYRNSKLTRLLQDSLGGNSQTLMLACISPAESNLNETISTIKYATRAKYITNTVKLNQEQSLTDTLKEEIIRLKQELELNDAFMREVHVELDNLRSKNQSLMNRKSIDLDILHQHRARLKKESAFIKQIKNNIDNNTTLDVINSLIQMFQSSIKEQKQLLSLIDYKQSPSSSQTRLVFSPIPSQTIPLPMQKESSIPTPLLKEKNIPLPTQHVTSKETNLPLPTQHVPTKEPSIPKETQTKPLQLKKPSKIKKPKTIQSNVADVQHVTAENQMIAQQLIQVSNTLKKALSLTSNSNNMSQIKPILNRAISICNTSDMIKKSPSTITAKSKPNNHKNTNIEELHNKIRQIISIEHIKSHPICLDIVKSFKQEKIKLLREQKDLLKERKDMLKEYYKENFEEQQQNQQYMDERIDMITVQVDFITESIKLLSSIPTLKSANIQNNLIDLLKPLKEGDLRALILLLIQQDVVLLHLTKLVDNYTLTTLQKYQQGIIQLRRTSSVMNNQIILDLLKSPARCLSNGLLLISGK